MQSFNKSQEQKQTLNLKNQHRFSSFSTVKNLTQTIFLLKSQTKLAKIT